VFAHVFDSNRPATAREADLLKLPLLLQLLPRPDKEDARRGEWRRGDARCFHCVFTEIMEPAGCYFSADSDSYTTAAAGETITALLHF